jgi:hypothetical protein
MSKQYIKCLKDGFEGMTKGETYEVLVWHDYTRCCTIENDEGREDFWWLNAGEFELVEDSPQFPVGTQCQARTQQNGFWCRWKDITVMGYYEDLIWFSHGDVKFTSELSQVELREKNSERERYVETAAPILYHSYSPDEKGMELLAGHLYDLGFKLPDEET